MRGLLLKRLDAEIDFSAYARGGDVDTNDLIVAMVKRGDPVDTGAVRHTDERTLTLDGVPVTLKVASFAMGSSLATMAHELMHALLDRSSTDLYGPSTWNTPASLMGATGGARFTSHPDAQHKVLLGWEFPDIVDVSRRPNGTTSQHSMLAAGATDVERSDRQAVLIIHDGARSPNEFFALEYRTSSGGTDAGYRYEWALDEAGLAIWHVETIGNRIADRRTYLHTASLDGLELQGDDVLTGRGWMTLQGGGAIGEGVVAFVTATGGVDVYRYSDWATGADWTSGTSANRLDREFRLRGEVLATDDGVLYEITESGALRWYRVENAAAGRPAWAPNSGSEVGLGRGWGSYRSVVAAGDGVLYAVKDNGALVWYRHDDWRTGGMTWTDTAEREVGSDRSWASYETVLSGGDGVLYAIKENGALVWHRHEDWRTGGDSWTDAAEREVGLGRGWGIVRSCDCGWRRRVLRS